MAHMCDYTLHRRLPDAATSPSAGSLDAGAVVPYGSASAGDGGWSRRDYSGAAAAYPASRPAGRMAGQAPGSAPLAALPLPQLPDGPIGDKDRQNLVEDFIRRNSELMRTL